VGTDIDDITVIASNACGVSTERTLTIITIPSPSTIVFTSGGQSQILCAGNVFEPTVYTYGGTATGATVDDLPYGLTYNIDESAKTVTISGTPIVTGTYIITADGTCPVSINGSVIDPPCEANSFTLNNVEYVDIKVAGAFNSSGVFVGSPLSAPNATKTLRFMTTNLGANSNLDVKAQMKYPGCPTDMTVYGGWYQWGRKDAGHTFRCYPDPDLDHDDRFTTDLVLTSSLPADHGKFVYGSPNWIDVDNLSAWGNGGGSYAQANTNYIPPQNSQDPCPTGWRVPTQHEWALISNDDGALTPYDLRYNAEGINLLWSGIVWVRVEGGFVSDEFLDNDNMKGYAL
jgi:hypothetical protein